MIFALLLSLSGGVVLFWSQPPRRANFLQFFALGALLWSVWSISSPGLASLCGVVFALGYVGLQLLELRLPLSISAILALSQSALWTLFACGAASFARFDPIACAFLTASLGAALTFGEWSLLPLWGTAQNFARGWSRAPQLVQFVAFTGVCGAIWCLFLTVALVTQLALNPRDWLRVGWVLVCVIGIVTALNCSFWQSQRAAERLRVAAFGWGEWDGATDYNRLVVRAVRQAAEQGAKLLVTPEAAFQVADRAAFRRIFCDLAKNHQIALAIGYFDTTRDVNCTDFINTHGEVESRYVKTHLVPIFETYQRGKGEVAQLDVDGALVGGLICQDDNFADVASRYGRLGTQILAIPTHDWRAVKDFHAVNAVWRGLEFRLGLVKAASGGISFITSPRGKVLARCDHLQDGTQLIIADMPLSHGKPTLYACWRDYFPVLCALLVSLALVVSHTI